MSQKVLEAEDVEVIYSRLCNGDRGARIAEDFAISQQSVSAIKCGKSWGHVTGLGEPLNPRNRVTRAILTEIQVLVELQANDVVADPHDGCRDLFRRELDLNLLTDCGHVRNDRHQPAGGEVLDLH